MSPSLKPTDPKIIRWETQYGGIKDDKKISEFLFQRFDLRADTAAMRKLQMEGKDEIYYRKPHDPLPEGFVDIHEGLKIPDVGWVQLDVKIGKVSSGKEQWVPVYESGKIKGDAARFGLPDDAVVVPEKFMKTVDEVEDFAGNIVFGGGKVVDVSKLRYDILVVIWL